MSENTIEIIASTVSSVELQGENSLLLELGSEQAIVEITTNWAALAGSQVQNDIILDPGDDLNTIEILTPESPGEVAPTWSKLVTEWDYPPGQVGTIGAGRVFSYTLAGIERFRLVPSPYTATSDSFYSSFANNVLSGKITSRSQ